MIELVIPDVLEDHTQLDDDRLSEVREMVGRRVYTFDGPLAEGLTVAEQLSDDARNQPVLINDVTSKTGDMRTVDVYVHQNGQQMSVSKGVDRPRRD